jgi:hypothetical protein
LAEGRFLGRYFGARIREKLKFWGFVKQQSMIVGDWITSHKSRFRSMFMFQIPLKNPMCRNVSWSFLADMNNTKVSTERSRLRPLNRPFGYVWQDISYQTCFLGVCSVKFYIKMTFGLCVEISICLSVCRKTDKRSADGISRPTD